MRRFTRIHILCAALLLLTAGVAVAAEPFISEGDVPVNRGFMREEIVKGLEHPWGMTWLPDGTILITERPGRLRIVRDGALAPGAVPGVPEVLAFRQGGLLDVSAHPQFAENRFLYLTYAAGTEDANHTRVARGVFENDALTDVEVIFEVSQKKSGGQHFGSRLAWLPDGTLLVSIGDGGNPPVTLEGEYIRLQAQELDSHLGKVLRLNDDGSAPADNPFADTLDAEPQVYSYGHRNIQGMTYDPIREMVWASEHGALGGDELNAPQPGENYGWPIATYSREYSDGDPIGEGRTLPRMVNPKVVWLSAIAPSGLMLYTGDAFPDWRGDLFAGGLISQDIRHLELDDAGAVVNQRALRMGQRVRDVRQGPDGMIYVLTDEDTGRLLRLVPETADPAEPDPTTP